MTAWRRLFDDLPRAVTYRIAALDRRLHAPMYIGDQETPVCRTKHHGTHPPWPCDQWIRADEAMATNAPRPV